MARRIIDQWNTKTIGGSGKLSKDDFDTVSDAIHVEQSNIENMKMVNLVGQATNTQSQSGPIPKTCKIVTATTTASSAIVELFTPSAGEVWQVGGFAINKTGLAGTLTWRLIATDGAQSTTIDMSMVWGSSSQDPISATEDGFTPFFVDENMTLKFTVYFGGGFPAGEEAEGQVYLTRVR